MLTSQDIECELSYAYLHAIASRAGIICECAGRHTDNAGVDATLRVKGRLDENSVLTNFTVDVQLKATINDPIGLSERLPYSLNLKNYNDLRSLNTTAPQLLVVLFLPQDVDRWLSHSEEGLIARRCAYWLSLRNAVESRNKSSQTVYIPKENLLSVQNLNHLLTRFSRQEVIDYVA